MPKRKTPIIYVKCVDDMGRQPPRALFVYPASAPFGHRYRMEGKKYPLITRGNYYKATFFAESPFNYYQLLTTDRGTLSRKFVNGAGRRLRRGVFKRDRFEIVTEGEYLTWQKSKTQ